MEASHIVQMFYFDIWATTREENPNLTFQEVIEPGTLEAFARRRTLGLNIVKLNLLDLDGKVLWSSVPSAIGKPTVDTDSHATVVSRGTSSSNLHRDEVVTESSGAERRLDVVRTFFPLRDAPLDVARESKTIGVLEIEQDVTEDLADARRDSLRSAIQGSIGLGIILFALLLLIIFRADRIIGRGHRRLLRQQEELQATQAETMQLNESLDRRVAERTAELAAANRELEAFSYSVSHDLRAPLRAMDGFSRILVQEHGPQLVPEAQRYLQLVRDNAIQMGHLVDDLLNFSRLSRQPIQKQPVAPELLVQQALKDLGNEQEGRRVEISVGALPICQGDPALLKQVFLNLLGNSLKYTRKRDVASIDIGYWDEGDSHNPGKGVYFVKDNGIGFDMRQADNLFGVFQRLHRSQDYEGTGVGLAIVQRIIHRHGGRIWAEAEVDKGAIFYFTLEEGSGIDTNV